eukprot:scaffold1219_cov400-Prasinococcus_capsulatus_cf.AAC.26
MWTGVRWACLACCCSRQGCPEHPTHAVHYEYPGRESQGLHRADKSLLDPRCARSAAEWRGVGLLGDQPDAFGVEVIPRLHAVQVLVVRCAVRRAVFVALGVSSDERVAIGLSAPCRGCADASQGGEQE